MKNRTLIALTLFAGFGLSASAQSVVNSKHDLSTTTTSGGAKTNATEVCVFCHTPHQPSGQTTDPLWNHTLASTASYGVYASTTLNATVADIGGGATASNLCMSCHDGTVSVASLYNNPSTGAPTMTAGGNVSAAGIISGSPLVGTDISNDHPVNFDYNAGLVALDADLKTPASASFVDAASTVPLFASKVQCASCHDAHDNSNGSFLVVSNSASALCLKCHTK